MQVRDASGTLRTVAGIAVRDASNVLRTIAGVAVRDAANVLRNLAGGGGGFGFGATADPTSVYGYGSSQGLIQVTTTPTAVTAAGGTPPYSHSWAPDDPAWSAVNPGSAVTQFRSPVLAGGESSAALFTDIITDANGATTAVDVAAYATNFGM
jgi:hypothetical protein